MLNVDCLFKVCIRASTTLFLIHVEKRLHFHKLMSSPEYPIAVLDSCDQRHNLRFISCLYLQNHPVGSVTCMEVLVFVNIFIQVFSF